jgi:hypothetical protein
MKDRVSRLRAASFFAAALFLVAALLFAAACKQQPDDADTSPDPLDTRLVGRWRSAPGENTEGYNITEKQFEYQDGKPRGVWDMSYKGRIRYTKRFSPTDGVIIIEYTGSRDDPDSGWPQYTRPGHTISPWVGKPIPGPFFGVYYRNLSDTAVTLANSTTLGSTPPYKPPETATLAQAIAKFTLANRPLFVAGVALPQTRWGD